MPDVSVVVCTHNPRPEYLTRVLAALRGQTLPADRWELLLVDNASREKLADRYDLSWHPQGRHAREDELGLTPARLRGIAETRADLIVFVDDDNVLEPDYLAEATALADRWAVLGVWGGQCVPEFEVEPVPHLRPYVGGLALRTTDRDYWSNFLTWDQSHPFGAGMCVRRTVAVEYARRVTADPVRKALDRRGIQLTSAGDYDLTRLACDMGFGCGVFRALRLTHLIPAGRVREDYLLRLYHGFAYSNAILDYLYNRPVAEPTVTWPAVVRRVVRYALRSPARTAERFNRASRKGTSDAIREWGRFRVTGGLNGPESERVEP